MFRKRRSSQKPHEDFYAAFKQSFPEVGPGSSSAGRASSIAGPAGADAAVHGEAIVDGSPINRSLDGADDQTKDQDVTPKPYTDQWRLTPSLMDPTSFAFSAFANQPPGYYTPTPGGFNTFYHSSAAGDLHTPGMGMNTPLSLPHSMHAINATDPSLQYATHFNPQLLPPSQHFADSFPPPHELHAPQLFAPPSHFLHQDSGYVEGCSQKTTPAQLDPHGVPAGALPPNAPFDPVLVGHDLPSPEKFRFHTTLNAPTAMVRRPDEIPVTYLNKGQAYTMSIFDLAPPAPPSGPVPTYRTYVRVSFEDEQQRAKPGACWQLWKEGRGTNEAHQRGGKLLAVEYVDPNQGGDEQLRKSHIELEQASFDGFAVTWYPGSRRTGAPDCSISVRFNFLSTDFSHSKGVKGIPVRLCAKTELVTAGTAGTAVPGPAAPAPEVCFSKVKLFRDHGAERKLSNDIAHVKKSIDKLKQQIAQADSGLAHVSKRKRSGSTAKEPGKMSADEDLHAKLVGLQDMFSSTRPLSILFLRGDADDDPDVFPVKLAGSDEIIKAGPRTQTWESRHSTSGSPGSHASSTLSPTEVTPKRKLSAFQAVADPPPLSPEVDDGDDGDGDDDGDDDGDAADGPAASEEHPRLRHSASPSRPSKMRKIERTAVKDGVVALDVDHDYQPPDGAAPVRPVACFYVREQKAREAHYRAVYLYRRTVDDLVAAISTKYGIRPSRIAHVTHVNAKGLFILVDDEVVQAMTEGQDMSIAFAELGPPEASEGPFPSCSGSPDLRSAAPVVTDRARRLELSLFF